MEAINKKAHAQSTPKRINLSEVREKAFAAHKKGDLDQAINCYKLCLRIKLDDAGIWNNLGAAYRRKRQYQSAVNCYMRALEIVPDDIAAMGNLGNVLKDLHRFDEALALQAQVVQAYPHDVQALTNYACVLREASHFQLALDQLDKAAALAPGDAKTEWERAQNLLYLGRYSEGWQAYESRWSTGDLPARQFPYPQWQGEPLQYKRILLHTEQGYGDTILAVRFIPQLKQYGAHVTLMCKPELHRLFKNVEADLVISDSSNQSEADPRSAVAESQNRFAHPLMPPAGMEFDFHCPLMSLMAGLNTQPNDIPQPASFFIPEEAQKKFAFLKQQFPGDLKVGIVWSGSITFANNVNRAVDIEAFLPLAEIPRVRLYSLQKGPRESDLYRAGAECYIGNIGRICDDFADTAAAISNLDVIVMTDSSVAHLAASLGKPVINLLQNVPYWIYCLEDNTSPWYPSMRLIKQTVAGQWETVFDEAKRQLTLMRDAKVGVKCPPVTH